MPNWTKEELAARNLRVFGPAHESDPRLNRDYGAVPDQPEALIQAECTKILECDGWRALRTDPVSDRGKGKGFGEVGMADYLYIRYMLDQAWRRYMGHGIGEAAVQSVVSCSVLWIEFKRGRGGVLSKSQRAWHTKERARGALTLIAGEDFPASVAGFREWYRASGLQR